MCWPRSEAEIRRSFLDEVGRAADDRLAPVAHLVSSWSIEKARDVALLNARTIWELRRTPALKAAYLHGLAHTVGMGSRLLLAPAGLRVPRCAPEAPDERARGRSSTSCSPRRTWWVLSPTTTLRSQTAGGPGHPARRRWAGSRARAAATPSSSGGSRSRPGCSPAP